VKLLKPDGWARPVGYTDGILAPGGKVLYVSGQVGWNPMTAQFETDDFAAQAARALENVAAVLAAGGARPEDLCRMTWFITDRKAYLAARKPIGEAWRQLFGRHFPAMSVVVVAGLIEERALVEIEATAVLSHFVETVGA
jgi:enamine deaminase RidA (YjgF/YER057c/UK114 family)